MIIVAVLVISGALFLYGASNVMQMKQDLGKMESLFVKWMLVVAAILTFAAAAHMLGIPLDVPEGLI